MTARQSDEAIQKDLENHIKDESDPRERARLLIMLAMLRTIVDNVVAVREVTEEFRKHREAFDSHIEEERRIMNQGRGAVRLAVFFVFVIQLLSGYIFVEHMAAFKEFQANVLDHTKRLAAYDERHRQEDQRQ